MALLTRGSPCVPFLSLSHGQFAFRVDRERLLFDADVMSNKKGTPPTLLSAQFTQHPSPLYWDVLHGTFETWEGGGGGISQNLYRPSPALLQHTWSSASAQLAFWRSSSSWAHVRAHLWAPKTIFPPALGGVAVNPLCSQRRYLRVAKA